MKTVLLFCLFIMVACHMSPVDQPNCDKSGYISHVVLLDTKDSLNQSQKSDFVSKLQLLASIPQVHYFELGEFKDLDDPRALRKYDYVIQMEFVSVEDYIIYQNSSTHLNVKKSLGSFLMGPPASYDYLIH